MLGQRESKYYSTLTLKQINSKLTDLGQELGIKVYFFQSNYEGELVEAIQTAGLEKANIVLNAGAYTHTSIAIRDAVIACRSKVLEVHLSNPHHREEFRHISLLSGVCVGLIAGFAWTSYALALTWLARYANN